MKHTNRFTYRGAFRAVAFLPVLLGACFASEIPTDKGNDKSNQQSVIFSEVSGISTEVVFAHMPAPDRGSFLRKPAHSVHDVVMQIQNDPIVADRFIRHFHMSKGDVMDYISSLHPMLLAEDGVYNVYNVHEDGVIRMKPFHLKRGTPVYADADNTPVLKARCANPMVVGRKPNPGEPQVSVDEEPTEVGSQATSVEQYAKREILEPSFSPAPTPPTPEPPPPVVKERLVIERKTNYLGLLGIVGLAGLLNTHRNHCCPPVPEPTTLALFAMAPVALVIRKKFKK